MTTEATLGTLTAEDVAALRMASAVTFHHFEGRAYIRAHLDHSVLLAPVVYTAREQRIFTGSTRVNERCRDIPCESHVGGYHQSGSWWNVSEGETTVSCFYMIHAAQYSATWPTLAHLLHSGQTVSLSWIADNNSETIETHRLHVDELRLVVKGKGDRVQRFTVATTITPDNSARMIRRNGA